MSETWSFSEFPHLSLEQILDVLSFYLENQDEIDELIELNETEEDEWNLK